MGEIYPGPTTMKKQYSDGVTDSPAKKYFGQAAYSMAQVSNFNPEISQSTQVPVPDYQLNISGAPAQK